MNTTSLLHQSDIIVKVSFGHHFLILMNNAVIIATSQVNRTANSRTNLLHTCKYYIIVLFSDANKPSEKISKRHYSEVIVSIVITALKIKMTISL